MAEKERILVVDDEESAREMVSKIVNQIGYEAVTAKNGNEVLEILRNTPTPIMIADIKMSEMDGVEWIKSIRTEFPDTYIICMTGQGASHTHTDLVAFGAADYITKPFTIDEMRAKLDRVIRERNLVEDLIRKSAELERANEELKRQDQIKTLFISNVSHELRTPLTVIKEFISLMLEGYVETSLKTKKNI